MTSSSSSNFPEAQLEEALNTVKAFSRTMHTTVNAAGDTIIGWLYPALEQATNLAGRTVAPIADLPFVRFATGVPGLSWVLAALGQVKTEKVETAIAELRAKYPLETNEELAQRVIAQTTFRAAQVGLLTNVIPPLAVFLFAIDIGAIAALQAEMIYKIAAIYGFSAQDPTRRGEVLAIWGVFTGSSSTLKSGLSFLEVLPGAGAAIGITSDAAIIYGVGFLACRYYEVKLARQPVLQA
jgi:uncharacterized protein (DUF697 family)